MILLATAALAGPPGLTRVDFGPFHGTVDPNAPRVATAGSGANKLDVYRSGDLAVLYDTDGEWFAELLEQGGDINWAIGSAQKAFYQDFGDDYQYLTLLITRDFGFFAAFYSPLANDVRGIGYDAIVRDEVFDQSAETQLDGFIFMNYYGMWTEDPAVGRYVFGQEFMHRWGSFVNIEKDGLEADALLGRDTAHWSYYLHTPNSPMEGNAWVDNGDGTWTTSKSAASTYSDLDLYLMGLVGPDEVGPQTFLQVDEEAAVLAGVNPATTPVYLGGGADVTLPATPITFTLDDIIAAEGPREPSVEDSPKEFRMAFLVLVLQDDPFDDAVIAEIEGLRQTFEADWEEDVGHRADLITTLGKGTAPVWGATPDVDTGDTDAAEVDCCKEEAETPSACGCDTGSSGLSLLGLSALALLRRSPRAPVRR